MTGGSIGGFFRSRPGSYFIIFAVTTALLSFAVGWGSYMLNLRWYVAEKSEDKITALRLVDAFVTNYSEIRSQFADDDAPVPATFRAHSIDLFNRMRDADDVARLLWVGRPGRAIATPPVDPAMAGAIEAFAREANPAAQSRLLSVGGNLVFRTLYPSIATQQSCVDCHNRLQPDKPQWQLNDVMGAFAIDVPAGAFMHGNLVQGATLGAALFFVLFVVGIYIAVQSYRGVLEREAASERATQGEERFRDFAESSSDWFWEQDQDLRFTYMSEPSAESGLTVVGYLGKTPDEIVRLGVTDEQQRAHEANLAARRPFKNFRFVRFTPTGEPRHVSVSGKPVFDRQGRFLGYRGTAKDITAEVASEIELARRVEARTAELRAAQDELIRKERLSVLGQLTPSVAHKLRNPLGAIRNSAFAVKEIATRHSLVLDRPFQRIERAIARCDRIIVDLLDYTRLGEPRFTWVVGDDWLGDLLAKQRQADGIALRSELAAPGVRLLVDPARLHRAVVNLIDNAVQAVVDLRNDGAGWDVVVSTRQAGDRYEIVVADTGPGIAADVLPRVFEPLFSTKSFGSGLGLPTVKQIVEQHRGSVAIASEPGQGTRVVVSLPIPPARGAVA